MNFSLKEPKLDIWLLFITLKSFFQSTQSAVSRRLQPRSLCVCPVALQCTFPTANKSPPIQRRTSGATAGHQPQVHYSHSKRVFPSLRIQLQSMAALPLDRGSKK